MTIRFHGLSAVAVLEFLIEHEKTGDFISYRLTRDVNGVSELSIKFGDGQDVSEEDLPGLPVEDVEGGATPNERGSRGRK